MLGFRVHVDLFLDVMFGVVIPGDFGGKGLRNEGPRVLGFIQISRFRMGFGDLFGNAG